MDERDSQIDTSPALTEYEFRTKKAQDLKKEQGEAWPSFNDPICPSASVLAEFSSQEGKKYGVAGRLMSIRSHGKTVFANLQDSSAKIQLYITLENVGEEKFEFFKNFVDIGDIVWAHGTSFKTKTGEVSLKTTSLRLLSKSLHPLPEKFHGLVDTETRYRQRYLDLISNADSREKFLKRSKLISAIRSFFDQEGFIEVETPMLHPIAGGAAARPFITHHNALGSDFYLRIAPELYLKRLVVGGFDKVYEINRNFRNEGVSTRHNPEFTMLEFYWAYHDYHFIMNFIQNLLQSVALQTCGTLFLTYGTHTLDFSQPFKKLSVVDAIVTYGGYSPDLVTNSLDTLLNKEGIKVPGGAQASWGVKLCALFEKVAEPHLIQPTFITHYPIEVSPLAKKNSQNPLYADRFELFIGGMELANGFNELNDPYDQAERFKEQLTAHAAGDAEAHQYDADYIVALEHALPPTVGTGIGIDRLTMLLTNTPSIRDVILFPTLKKKVAEKVE